MGAETLTHYIRKTRPRRYRAEALRSYLRFLESRERRLGILKCGVSVSPTEDCQWTLITSEELFLLGPFPLISITRGLNCHTRTHTHSCPGGLDLNAPDMNASSCPLMCFHLCLHAGDWDYHCLDPAVWHVSVREVSGSCLPPYSQLPASLPASLCPCSTRFHGSHPKRATT